MGRGLVCHSEFRPIIVFTFTSRRRQINQQWLPSFPCAKSLVRHFFIDSDPPNSHMGFCRHEIHRGGPNKPRYAAAPVDRRD